MTDAAMLESRGRGRPRQTSHDEIRDVAFALFAERGYAATSLGEIAAAVGVSRTTLFAYFPAKKDLVREDFMLVQQRLHDAVHAEPDPQPLDAVVRWLAAMSPYSVADHAGMATRWRIVQSDDELRADVALQLGELADLLAEEARRVAPDADAELVDHLTRALAAVAARCTEEWTRLPRVEQDLDAYLAPRLRTIADALRPLLRQRASRAR